MVIELPDGSAPPACVAYRELRYEDLAELHDVDNTVFGKLAYPFFVLRQLYDLFRRYSLVVEVDGRIGGYVLVGIESGASRRQDVAWVLGLGVLPPLTGRGYGKELLSQALELCVQAGIREARITVRQTNESAVRLYTQAGFREFHSEPTYFGEDEPRSVLRMTLLPLEATSAACG